MAIADRHSRDGSYLVAFLDPLRRVDGVVRQGEVGAGALDGDQGLQNGVTLVEVARSGGSLQHGILTGYLIGGDR